MLVHRRLLFALLFLTLPTLLVGFAVADGGGKPPDDPHAAGKVALPAGANEVAFCNACHKQGCPAPHPELVKMSWQPSGRAVLGVHGEITCGSCHTRGFRRRGDAFLARDQKGLCVSCHYGAHAISNAHDSDRRCETCHTHPKDVLAHTTPVETKALKSAVDSECMRCHYDGPVTHRIGILNTKKKAPDLPLSSDGKITCITCHIGHNQQNRFGVMLRKDNRRGGLCLSCHDDL